MAPSYQQRDVTFWAEAGMLYRRVTGTKRGEAKAYDQFCTLEVLKEVVWYIDEAKFGTTTGELWQALDRFAKTQVSVALDFLKEKSIVGSRRRRVFCVSDYGFEDAMIEFHYLEHVGAEPCGT